MNLYFILQHIWEEYLDTFPLKGAKQFVKLGQHRPWMLSLAPEQHLVLIASI